MRSTTTGPRRAMTTRTERHEQRQRGGEVSHPRLFIRRVVSHSIYHMLEVEARTDIRAFSTYRRLRTTPVHVISPRVRFPASFLHKRSRPPCGPLGLAGHRFDR